MVLVAYFVIFGVISMVLGVLGLKNAGSKASLIAGTVSGILLIAAGLMLRSDLRAGLILGLVVCVLLAGRFVPAFLKDRRFYPAGLMALLSVLGLLLSLAHLIR